MKLTVHLEGKSKADLAAGLRAHLALFEEQVAAAPKTTKTAARATEAEETTDEEEEEFSLDDAEGEEADAEETTEEEEKPAPKKTAKTATTAPAPAAKKVTHETVIKAFKEYASENGREAAGKVLKKYGVSSVRDLPEAKLAEVLKKVTG